MLDYISLHKNSKSTGELSNEEEPDDGERSWELSTVTLKVDKDIEEKVWNARVEFVKERYHEPGFLILGWKTWLVFGYAMSNFMHVYHKVDEWRGIPIIVDDDVDEMIRFTPSIDNVVIGGV